MGNLTYAPEKTVRLTGFKFAEPRPLAPEAAAIYGGNRSSLRSAFPEWTTPVVADMTVKANGDVPESTFFRAVVNNHAKFSYEEPGFLTPQVLIPSWAMC